MPNLRLELILARNGGHGRAYMLIYLYGKPKIAANASGGRQWRPFLVMLEERDFRVGSMRQSDAASLATGDPLGRWRRSWACRKGKLAYPFVYHLGLTRLRRLRGLISRCNLAPL